MFADKWNSALYDQKHAFVYEYGRELIALLDPQPGERILDVGSGTGHLTRQIADAGATVIGLDASAEMIATARRAYPDLEFVQADATDFSFPETFDAIFSNATLHWVTKAEAAIERMSRALRSGGRFVVEFGGEGNVARILNAISQAMREAGLGEFRHDWYYPTIGEYAPLLERRGLMVDAAWLFDRMTKLEGEDGIMNWLRMFGTVKTARLSDEERQRVFDLAVEKARDSLYLDGQWYADYRRLRIVAHRE
jgi:trans-aconitate methyltransferase